MAKPWTAHGQNADCPWTAHRLPVGAHGWSWLPTDNPWSIHGQYMDCPRAVHGQTLEKPSMEKTWA
eukprot:10854381-Lingulodinium_polyedra.AAC.1